MIIATNICTQLRQLIPRFFLEYVLVLFPLGSASAGLLFIQNARSRIKRHSSTITEFPVPSSQQTSALGWCDSGLMGLLWKMSSLLIFFIVRALVVVSVLCRVSEYGWGRLGWLDWGETWPCARVLLHLHSSCLLAGPGSLLWGWKYPANSGVMSRNKLLLGTE